MNPEPVNAYGPSLVPADLDRLGTLVIKQLREFFLFSEGTCWSISEHTDGLPPVRLSERQKQRATQALSEGQGFWDRIGQQVLIPIRKPSAAPNHPIHLLGFLVLNGVDHSIGPEEADRLIPVLQAWVEDRLRILRLEYSISRYGEIPPYVDLTLEAICRKTGPLVSLLHLENKPSAKTDPSVPERIIDLCSMLWGNSYPEWLGGNSRDYWILLPGIDQDTLSSGLKRLFSRARAAKVRLSKAYGHQISVPLDMRQAREDVKDLERSAEELGTACFCTADLKAFEDRLGIEGLVLRLNQAKKAVKGGSRSAVAYIKSVPNGLEHSPGQEVEYISAGEESAFLIKRQDGKAEETNPVQWANEIHGLCTALQGVPSTFGIAVGNQPALGPSKTPAAALWAFVHADLLGNGSFAVHDSLTWNVRGDEIFSWGDLRGACRDYRIGLKIEPSSANLLNSLGVCLAELRRTKEAVNVFSRAVEASPEDFMALYNLGGVYLREGDLGKARQALKRAHTLEPDDERIASRTAEVLIECNHAQEALDVLIPLTEKKDRLVNNAIFRILGKAYMALNRWPKAKTSWQQAIKNNPGDFESLALLALGYIEETRDWKTAAKIGRQAEALGGESRQIRTILKRLKRKLRSIKH